MPEPTPSDDTRSHAAAAPGATPTVDEVRPGAGGAGLPVGLGRFVVEGEIGRGGMGCVLRAHDPDLGRDLAVKVLLPRPEGRPELERRFLEEARISGRLEHPGVPPVHELGRTADGRPFFTMKLIKGRTLAELLKERPRGADATPLADLPRFLAVFEQVAQTLAFAHSKGVIHRDLKPSNVMVGRFGEVQVTDWGLAKILASGAGPRPDAAAPVSVLRPSGEGLSQDGSVLGTPAYMAPEQARGQIEKLDERVDVFGLGALLCEILTGQPPFARGEASVLIRRSARGEVAEALARLDGCGADAELIALARVCLAPEAVDRPRDAGEVAARVTAYRAGVEQRLRQAELERAAAQARADEARAKARAERRARRLTLGLAAAVLALVVLGGGAAAWWWWQRAETVTAVEASLADVRSSLEADRLAEARQALERAEGRLGDGGPSELRRRVEQARADVEMARELDEIRLGQSALKDDHFDVLSAGPKYARAFQRYQLDVDALEPGAVIARIRASAIRPRLLAALDDWSQLRKEKETLRRIADGADDDEWRRRMRAVKTADEARQLAGRAEVWAQPPATVTRFAIILKNFRLHAEAVAGLLLAQQRHPGDLWINHHLGDSLTDLKPLRAEEAVSFLRAAVALRPDSPVGHLNLGYALSKKKDMDGAIASYRKAIELAPNFAAAHNNLGFVLAETGDVNGAIASYHKALDLDPNYAAAYYGLGNALKARKDLDGAIACFHKAVEVNPNYADGHNGLGTAFYARKDMEGAIACYRKAIELDPNLPEPYSNLGAALFARGDVDGAIDYYCQALHLDPSNAKVHTNIGLALQDKGDVAGAIACCRKAIELDPNDANAHNSLGNALKARKELDEAIACYRKAIELDPNSAAVHYNLGNVLRDKGRLDEAIACYRKAIDLDPNDAMAHHNLGTTLTDKGDVDEAIAHYCQTLHLDPRHALAHYHLGNALHDRGAVGVAVACFRQSIQFDPNFAPAHFNLGIALKNKGDVAGAIASYREAIKLDPNRAGAHNNLGVALRARKDVDEAIACFRQAIRLDPKLAQAHYNLGNALQTKGHMDEAIASYGKAIQLNPSDAQAHNDLGTALTARGKVAEAVAAIRKAIVIDPKFAVAHGGLGLALLRAGQFSEARVSTQRCLDLLPQGHPTRRVAAQQIQQCDYLLRLDAKVSAILKGEARAAGAAELLELAYVCRLTRRHATAVRFFADAFGADPKQADNLRADHRSYAGRSAALAGAGQGDDAPRDDKDRASLRARALDWLRADLAAWTKLLDGGNPPDRPAVRARLHHWQTDAELSGVRHPWSLLRLPADECRQWQQLWADVGELLTKASKPGMWMPTTPRPPMPRIHPDKVRLLHGPYRCPRLRRGEWRGLAQGLRPGR
jgi:tetratricopeptide (TPR) repeat protein/tRNA A-37 threonylcarbamoyl transferase component Bud32